VKKGDDSIRVRSSSCSVKAVVGGKGTSNLCP
jgi:hypothetical protein